MDTLKKMGLAWLALIIVLAVVIIFYFTKINRCKAIDFVCDSAYLEENTATLYMRNHFREVVVVNMTTSSCKLVNWNINEGYKRYVWEVNKEMRLDITCRDYFDELDISLVYINPTTNLTHNDIISVKR